MSDASPPLFLLNPSAWALRAMAVSDVQLGVMPIEQVSFGDNYWSPEAFRNEMGNTMAQYFVLEQNETPEKPAIVGYVGLWFVVDEAHVTTLAISPHWRGHGLGHLIVLHCLRLALAKQTRWMTLEVRASNIAAQTLYFQYGFSLAGLRSKYYQDNDEDALIMTTEDLKTSALHQKLEVLEKQYCKRWVGQDLPIGFGLPIKG
jgi:[ribosomal protein S18]-alanine N-acetyltransferase